ncbi:D-alanyl-D-alanine carboxypeptidase/D-alanyl-D-alanine-endopeptidase [Candidatus Symbiothrix dinenymphae]|nr:D-alanyl-D-alanine carboxypeptidase/D-alanyl-D-alanine-endopeptidase [Candidatus Symbiothrix dinenymphae]
MKCKCLTALFLICFIPFTAAQAPPALKQFLAHESMRGASFSLLVKDVNSGKTLCAYDADRKLIPASVLKLVTTATALEVLGADYRFPTTLEYDGELTDSMLTGSLYIRGSGDPTLGSSYLATSPRSYTPDQNTFFPIWQKTLIEQGIHTICGSVIADESIFDTEGISMKWVSEDMGSHYGAGCYGLNVFDNRYQLYLNTDSVVGSKPEIASCVPPVPSLRFHNYLKTDSVATDSTFIIGSPFANERYLYGVVPANKLAYLLKGDIPDPALYMAQYLHTQLTADSSLTIEGTPTCYRLLAEANRQMPESRTELITTYSPPLSQIVRITNEKSQNLYAEALLRTLGLRYKPQKGEVFSSAGKGIQVIHAHWKKKGIDTSSLWMHDGSGIAAADKLTTAFLCNLLIYMATKSEQAEAFTASLPKAGLEGTVASFLRGTPLQGHAQLKSGSMGRVRAYAGYITKDEKQYAIVLIANNFTGTDKAIRKELEKLLLGIF